LAPTTRHRATPGASEDVGIDTGFSPQPGTLRAPDLSSGRIPDEPGWVKGVPRVWRWSTPTPARTRTSSPPRSGSSSPPAPSSSGWCVSRGHGESAPEVRCHYFVLPQRVEDHVLSVLVRKTETIKKELGSLSKVIDDDVERRLARGGIRHRDAASATATRNSSRARSRPPTSTPNASASPRKSSKPPANARGTWRC